MSKNLYWSYVGRFEAMPTGNHGDGYDYLGTVSREKPEVAVATQSQPPSALVDFDW